MCKRALWCGEKVPLDCSSLEISEKERILENRELERKTPLDDRIFRKQPSSLLPRNEFSVGTKSVGRWKGRLLLWEKQPGAERKTLRDENRWASHKQSAGMAPCKDSARSV